MDGIGCHDIDSSISSLASWYPSPSPAGDPSPAGIGSNSGIDGMVSAHIHEWQPRVARAISTDAAESRHQGAIPCTRPS